MKKTLFAIGEALIDFIPEQKGCDFSEVKSFSPKVGGAPANVLSPRPKRTQTNTPELLRYGVMCL